MNENSKAKPGLSTLCVHAGEKLDSQGATHTPLYNHSTFGFSSTRELLDVVEGRSEGNVYTRYGMNPTIRSVEGKLAALEGGEGALVFSSGMAAIAATLFAYCRSGEHVVCIGDVYGGTYELLGSVLPHQHIDTTFLLCDDIDRIYQVITSSTRVIFLETPGNPTLEIVDIEAVSRLAKANNITLVVDSTFGSPVNQSPLRFGADIVVHSATKYLGGHSDITGGVAIGANAALKQIFPWRTNLGQIMAPEVAFLLARSLRTLVVRVRQQNASGQAIANFLSRHPKVKHVNYPGLPDARGHDIAARQMRGFGGVVSFIYDGDAEATAAFVDRLEFFTIAVSLGGVESLVTQPVTTSHHDLDPAERRRRGIVDGLVRISCGLEDTEDLVADLQRALEA